MRSNRVNIKSAAVIKECREAIADYQLNELLPKAKAIGFYKLTKEEQATLRSGLIKLGEALTFCRDNPAPASIQNIAQQYANASNHVIHYQIYHSHLRSDTVTDGVLTTLIFGVDAVTQQIDALDAILSLSKPNTRGNNNFPFPFTHLVICLHQELQAFDANACGKCQRHVSSTADNFKR